MKTIWKFTLGSRLGSHDINLPIGAKILDWQIQHGEITFWAVVDSSAEVETRTFFVYFTGTPVPKWTLNMTSYRATLQMSFIVVHIFEK